MLYIWQSILGYVHSEILSIQYCYTNRQVWFTLHYDILRSVQVWERNVADSVVRLEL